MPASKYIETMLRYSIQQRPLAAAAVVVAVVVVVADAAVKVVVVDVDG